MWISKCEVPLNHPDLYIEIQHHLPICMCAQDERNQVLIAYLWIRQTWHDAHLKWNKEEYDGLEVIRIPSSLVWRPDLVLYNKSVRSHTHYFICPGCSSVDSSLQFQWGMMSKSLSLCSGSERMMISPGRWTLMWCCGITARSHGTLRPSLRVPVWWMFPTFPSIASSATWPSAHGLTTETRYKHLLYIF